MLRATARAVSSNCLDVVQTDVFAVTFGAHFDIPTRLEMQMIVLVETLLTQMMGGAIGANDFLTEIRHALFGDVGVFDLRDNVARRDEGNEEKQSGGQ